MVDWWIITCLCVPARLTLFAHPSSAHRTAAWPLPQLGRRLLTGFGATVDALTRCVPGDECDSIERQTGAEGGERVALHAQ